MTTITDYDSLVNAATEYLARDQDTTLIDRIPTFVQFAEAKFNRGLFVRQMETRSTTTIDTTSDEPEFISLPDDFQSMRRIRLSSVTGKPYLQFKSGVGLDEFRAANGDSTGRPQFFTIVGSEIELAPSPDDDYTIEMVYRATVPGLEANTTNWLLTLAPDLYLYATLLESAPYMKEDARIQTWALGLSNALDGLNQLGQTSAFNAGPLTMRVTGVTP